jgi:hypothetical protein
MELRVIGNGSKKIFEHSARVNLAMEIATRRYELGEEITTDEIDCLVSLRVSLEKLCNEHEKGIRRIRWVDIPEEKEVTADDVIQECCESTESVFGNTGVEVLAAYLDACGYDGLLWKFSEYLIFKVSEYIPLTDQDLAMLQNPPHFFEETNPHELRKKIRHYFIKVVVNDSPAHIYYATNALIEHLFNNPFKAVFLASQAFYVNRTHNLNPEFKEEYPEYEDAIYDLEAWKANTLLELLAEY